MSRKVAPAVSLALALALTLAALVSTGCGTQQPPKNPATLRGVVTSVARGANGAISMRVVWDPGAGAQLEFDAADVAVTADTKVFSTSTAEGQGAAVKTTANAIEVRDLVEVWITGPVRESYPVQADADAVLVFGTLAAGLPLPTPPGLVPPTVAE